MALVIEIIRERKLLAGASLLTIALFAMIAAPLVAGAKETLEHADRWSRPTSDFCSERASQDRPRLTEFLDELVGDNVIDQSQADEIETRLRARHEDHCLIRMLWRPGQAVRATAEAAGTDSMDVVAAIRSGNTLSEYANGFGVDDESLIAAIMEPSQTAAAELVANTLLTQVKADQLLSGLEEMVGTLIHRDDLGTRGPRHFRPGIGRGRLAPVSGDVGIDLRLI